MDEIKVINGPAEREKDLLPGVKHKIVVMSGKGGVGKSTIAVNIAAGLANRGHSVGILDADIHGPSVPRLLGATEERLEMVDGRIRPAEVLPRLKVISIAYFLEERDAPIVWRGPVKMGALRQFIEDVDWGDLDYLIVDLPPGTGDEPLTIAQLIPKADGAVIVTTPQDVALLDSRKTVVFSENLHVPVLGIVENMAGLACPHCGEEIDLFKLGGGEKAAKELNVPFLGRVPIDPEVVNAGDEGMPIVAAAPDSPSAKAFDSIVEKIVEALKTKEGKKEKE
jgi:ATP-binding protein involved in chromosome partitioning